MFLPLQTEVLVLQGVEAWGANRRDACKVPAHVVGGTL